jgi:hypothetical protein
MTKFIEIISNQAFIEFLGTFGLAVLLVLYFVLRYIPKKDKEWQKRYDELIAFWEKKYDELLDNYTELSRNYQRLEEHLRPESRMCSKEQGTQLANLGLDRDLYKLQYYMSEKIDGRRREDVGTFIAESIRSTNEAWSKFKSPFQNVPRIGDLYGVYTNGGESLKVQLEEMFQEEIPEEDRKSKIWNLLLANTEKMKSEFQEFLHNLSNAKEVTPYYAKA